jgi:PIN domain nuclease of toxin-antitoxin system
MAGESDRLGDETRRAITAGNERVVISAVVIWEVAIKRRLGKLEAPNDMRERLEGAAVELLPITARHADRVGTLPLHHRDPFDRLLIAQAELDGLCLVSGDAEFRGYEVDVIW